MDFWMEALHYTPREPAKNGWVVLVDPTTIGPNISLDKATLYPWRYKPDDDFIVLADPDDNLFCVVQI